MRIEDAKSSPKHSMTWNSRCKICWQFQNRRIWHNDVFTFFLVLSVFYLLRHFYSF